MGKAKLEAQLQEGARVGGKEGDDLWDQVRGQAGVSLPCC